MSDQHTTSRQQQERIARNQVTFREANEAIVAAVVRNDLVDSTVPFICECADRGCTVLVPLRLDEYEHVRSDPRWFFYVPGHTDADVSEVVETHESYVIAAKLAHAGELAEQADRREAAADG